jgi:uncharacterized membrane protein YhaH (DUF805 family)
METATKEPKTTGHRMGRLQYAFIFFVCQLIGVATVFIPEGAAFFRVLIRLILLAVLVAISVERLHDINRSGWWWLLLLVPVINLIFSLALLLKKGDDVENDFGKRVRRKSKPAAPPKTANVKPRESATLEEQLAKLKEMFDQGLLSEDVYVAGQHLAVEKFASK